MQSDTTSAPTSTSRDELVRARTIDPRLSSALDVYERLTPTSGWTCDGGAAVLNDLLSRAGMPAELRVGQYWYATDQARYDALGEYEPGVQDEHHHWVEVTDTDGVLYLLDPNGSIRGEPTIQPQDEAVTTHYVPRDDPNQRADWEFVSYSPLWDGEPGTGLLAIEEVEGDDGVDAYLAARP